MRCARCSSGATYLSHCLIAEALLVYTCTTWCKRGGWWGGGWRLQFFTTRLLCSSTGLMLACDGTMCNAGIQTFPFIRKPNNKKKKEEEKKPLCSYTVPTPMHYILLISPPLSYSRSMTTTRRCSPAKLGAFPPGSSRDLQTLIAPSPVLEAAIFRRVVTQTT